LIIKFGNKTETIKINKIIETTKKDEAEQMYEILDESYKEDFRKGVN
jgi:ribosomal 50S subunit-recycling heat shock protein